MLVSIWILILCDSLMQSKNKINSKMAYFSSTTARLCLQSGLNTLTHAISKMSDDYVSGSEDEPSQGSDLDHR